MAKYKSRVKNKYMGSGFEGYVASARTTEGLELAKALQNSGERGMRIANVLTDRKKDEAVDKIQTLYSSGKSMEAIQTEILAGQHPDLTGKYVEKTTQFHLGKVKAAETITSITNNINEYDFENNTLNGFYEKYLPDFKESDTSYTAGFASVFNEYRAQEAVKDATVRSAHASKIKIEEGRVQLSIIPDENLETDYIKKWNALNIDVPNTDGSDKPNKLYTNAELQKVIIADVTSIIKSATTMEEIERAETILNLDMGIGKNGQNIGTLSDRKSEEVDTVKALLATKKRAVLQNTRADEVYKKNKGVEAVWAEAFAPNEDGSPKNKIQLQEIQDKLKQFNDPQLVATFADFFNKNRTVNNDPVITDQFMIDIVSGEFENYDEMITEMLARGIPESALGTANIRWNQYSKAKETGSAPIYLSDATYTGSMSKILKGVEESFKPDASGLPNPNAKFASFNADNFIKNEILNWEADFEQTNGRKPKPEERRKMITELGKYVIETYRSDNVADPESLIPFEKAKENKKKEKEAEEKYKTDTQTNISNIESNIESIVSQINTSKSELPAYESSVLDTVNVFKDEEAEFNTKQIKDFATSILPTVFEGVEINQDFIDYIFENQNIDGILTPVSQSLGVTNEYLLEILKQIAVQNN